MVSVGDGVDSRGVGKVCGVIVQAGVCDGIFDVVGYIVLHKNAWVVDKVER